MSYLVDTNIISEFVQPKPNPAVLGWLTDHQAEGLFLSVITVGEIQQGINRLPKSVRRKRLQDWLYGSILRRYGDFILSIETKTMLVWEWYLANREQLAESYS
jgi:predicted nucleic acid-binding protein